MADDNPTIEKPRSKLTSAFRRLSARLSRTHPTSESGQTSSGETRATSSVATIDNMASAAPSGPEVFDLLIVTDITHSMRPFLRSLNSSLQDIIRISATTDCFSRIGVLGFSDYFYDSARNPSLTEWSGWHSRTDALSEVSQEGLLSFVKSLKTVSGQDWPEATKTGLAHAYQLMRPDAETIVLLYTDAPPHTERSGGLWQAEQDELRKPGVYGGTAERFADWVSAAKMLSEGVKPAHVFPILNARSLRRWEIAMFTYLSTLTGGLCLAFPNHPSADAISKLTVGLLLAWMGVDKQGAQLDTQALAEKYTFKDISTIKDAEAETDPKDVRYLAVARDQDKENVVRQNLNRVWVSLKNLAPVVPRREPPVMDFAARYKADPAYQGLVVSQLAEIIESGVTTLALNPVFGTLWRTVCNDRTNPARDGLITRFGFQVDRIEDAGRKERMKKWLEESYDWKGEILHIIKRVSEEERYPCVFLDPTVRFGRVEGEDDESGDSMTFTRDELLEIGRSCDYRILRRLGRILTRLTYVNSVEELPVHVKDIPEADVPRIPLALVEPKYESKFWKVLLHTVLPGTMLAARPAALLAALSVRMGIKPLEAAAYTELLAWRNNWNTLEIPETWNTSCLSLLLEADKKHQQSMADSGNPANEGQTILKAEDRRLFQALVDYKLLEMNLDTTLTAEVGWTPDKSKVPIGPLVTCKKCRYPRSVTVMAEDGVCGLCVALTTGERLRDETPEAYLNARVSKTDNADTIASWVECAMAECRAQYVVYRLEKLNVRSKCHYCRQKGRVSANDPDFARLTTAPCVTCTHCLNRIIYPAVYRPSDFDAATYQCPACSGADTQTKTIVSLETTARALAAENGTGWLLRNDDAFIPHPFQSRSLFYIVSNLSPSADAYPDGYTTLFPAKVSVLPSLSTPEPPPTQTRAPGPGPAPALTLRSKPIHNPAALLAALSRWVSSRRAQTATCSLCFTPSLPRRALRLACGGRRGCRERVCGPCARAWYGANAPGRVLNLAALRCPFCRRRPATTGGGGGLLPRGLAALKGLREAVEEGGAAGWVYAWCGGCGTARRFAERVCAAGVPEEVERWRCAECVVEEEEEEEEEERRRCEGGGESRREIGVVVKMCPGCGVATEKVDGCDHIACPTEGCGAHWCFNCGLQVGEREIYAHMSEVHGGWYDGREYEWGEGDEDWEEEEEDE